MESFEPGQILTDLWTHFADFGPKMGTMGPKNVAIFNWGKYPDIDEWNRLNLVRNGPIFSPIQPKLIDNRWNGPGKLRRFQ